MKLCAAAINGPIRIDASHTQEAELLTIDEITTDEAIGCFVYKEGRRLTNRDQLAKRVTNRNVLSRLEKEQQTAYLLKLAYFDDFYASDNVLDRSAPGPGLMAYLANTSQKVDSRQRLKQIAVNAALPRQYRLRAVAELVDVDQSFARQHYQGLKP